MPPFVFIEESGVYQIRRLSLHWSVFVARTFWEVHPRVDERTVEREREVSQSYEGEVFAYVEFQSDVVGTLGVFIRVDEACSSCHGVGPLYGAVESLVEGGQRDLFAARRIELIAEVDVMDVARLEVNISLHVGGEVEVVIDRRRHLAELWPVDRLSVREPYLVALVNNVSGVE